MDDVVKRNAISSAQTTGIGSSVEIENLTKSFGKVYAIDNVTFSIKQGELISLLGPSGSGKTTVLMNIAGFQTPDHGSVSIGSLNVLEQPAHKRNIGMVFQKYSLFPHMTVAENVAFPLRMRKWPKSRQKEAVMDALSVVSMAPFSDRLPAQLSGGQQQRVALARAIVFQPPLLLMDEPLGALDKRLREGLQIEIKRLQAQLNITILFVTHDQDEALALSDRIAVMNNGSIAQLGRPKELYNNPSSFFVADFMGDSNFFDGQVKFFNERTGEVKLIFGKSIVSGIAASGQTSRIEQGAPASVMVRPERLNFTIDRVSENSIRGKITNIKFAGHRTIINVDVAGRDVIVAHSASVSGNGPDLVVGTAVALNWQMEDAVVFAGTRSTDK